MRVGGQNQTNVHTSEWLVWTLDGGGAEGNWAEGGLGQMRRSVGGLS